MDKPSNERSGGAAAPGMDVRLPAPCLSSIICSLCFLSRIVHPFLFSPFTLPSRIYLFYSPAVHQHSYTSMRPTPLRHGCTFSGSAPVSHAPATAIEAISAATTCCTSPRATLCISWRGWASSCTRAASAPKGSSAGTRTISSGMVLRAGQVTLAAMAGEIARGYPTSCSTSCLELCVIV